MTKQVLFAKEARDKILEGVKKITDAVRVTMGASGKCVLIGDAMYGNEGMIPLPTVITKDGFHVTRHFSLPDPMENRGAMVIKEAAMKTVEEAGDSTTGTCILAEALISGGMKLIEEGANSQELKKGIDKAVEDAILELKHISIPVKDNETLFNVAAVSANNDAVIGRLIADAFLKIGHDGVIDIVESKSTETEIKITEGFKFSRGWISPFFVNNKGKELCEFEDALILMYEKRVNHSDQIIRAMEMALKSQRPLLIICEDAEGMGLAVPVTNTIRGQVRCCMVKCPSIADARREEMEDIAILTGGTYVSDSKGLGIKEIEIDNLGKAEKVIVSREETIIIGGRSDKKELENTLNDLKMNVAQAKNEQERHPIEKRIARLTGGIAVIHVGAQTETELKEKLDRCDDAVRSTKSAIQEGFVAGGGTAFLRVAQKIGISVNVSDDFKKGQELVRSVLSRPLKQMAENAGVDAAIVFKNVSEVEGHFGYNTKTGQIEDLVKSGIIDSAKALRCSLINAASVSGMLLISECAIETVY